MNNSAMLPGASDRAAIIKQVRDRIAGLEKTIPTLTDTHTALQQALNADPDVVSFDVMTRDIVMAMGKMQLALLTEQLEQAQGERDALAAKLKEIESPISRVKLT